jgi:hypothetical protein
MFSRIRRRITYTNVAMTLALVFAMSGGAFAATKYLITSTKQIKPSVLAQLKGKNGKNGTNGINGVNGAAGAQGPQGAKGDTGAAGSPGAKGDTGGAGSPGAKGSTVLNGAGAPSAGTGVNGDFYIDTTNNNIYGPKTAGGWGSLTALKGAAGAAGSPWTVGGVLPTGESEKGTWASINSLPTEEDVVGVSISYTIPLEHEPTAHFIGTNKELAGEAHESPAIASGECKGEAGKPEAAAGNLCVFAQNLLYEEFVSFVEPDNKVGIAFTIKYGTGAYIPGYGALGDGTWAVTAG